MIDDYANAEPMVALEAEIMPTPSQGNEILLDKLGHLEPTLKCALATFQRVEEMLANGGVNWRKLFERAKARVSG